MSLLEINQIHTYYGLSHILQGVSLRLEQGEAVALLGRNGVGKTTTIRSIVGFTPAKRGDIIFRGKPIRDLRPENISKLGVGLVPQGRRIFPNLSVRENLIVSARGAAQGGWTLERVYQKFPRLQERQNNLGNKLSGGEQMMLAIGRALLTNPTLLLLDEPSEGLAPLVMHEITAIVAELQKQGLSILLVEQNLKMALKIASRVCILNKGQVVWEGSSADLRASPELQHQHLGVS